MSENEPREDWTPSRLSFSMYSLYEQCPRKWEYQYIKGIRVGSTLSQIAGSFVHEVLDLLYQMPPASRDLENARKIAALEWTLLEGNEDFQNHKLSDEAKQAFKKKIWRNIWGLFSMEDPNQIDVVKTEMVVEIEIDGVPYKGIIDRVERSKDGKIMITDYKTSEKAPIPRFSRDKIDQVQMYAAMISEILGEHPARVRLLYPYTQDEIMRRSNPKVSKETIDKMKTTWGDIHDSLDAGLYEPRPSMLCGWCDFVAACPEGAAYVEKLRRNYHEGRRPGMKDHAPALQWLGIK